MAAWKRPSTDTPFHIDHEWWQASGKDLRVAVRGQLCRNCQARFPDHRNLEAVDWVDPETAEVMRADALLQTLRDDCAKKPDFIAGANSLVTNVFRVFLLNGNQALTPVELARQMPWTNAETILRTLAAGQVYLGIRPVSKLD
jgi:hypothetical protein